MRGRGERERAVREGLVRHGTARGMRSLVRWRGPHLGIELGPQAEVAQLKGRHALLLRVERYEDVFRLQWEGAGRGVEGGGGGCGEVVGLWDAGMGKSRGWIHERDIGWSQIDRSMQR